MGNTNYKGPRKIFKNHGRSEKPVKQVTEKKNEEEEAHVPVPVKSELTQVARTKEILQEHKENEEAKPNDTTTQFKELLQAKFTSGLPELNDFKPAYFVGAGVSIASRLPNFRDFALHMLNDLFPDATKFSKEQKDQVVNELRPEVLLQTIHNAFGDDIFSYYNWFNDTTLQPNNNHYFLAKALREGLPVLTTNIDFLIEKAYQQLYNEEVEKAYTEEQFMDVLKRKSLGGVLFKFHGTVDDIPSIRFLLSEVGHGVASGMQGVLSRLGKDYYFVMMGYSGCDNFSVQPVLRNLPEKKGIVWVRHENDIVEATTDQNIFKKELEDISKMLMDGKTLGSIPRGLETLSTLEILSIYDNSVLLKIYSAEVVPFIEEGGEIKKALAEKGTAEVKKDPPVLPNEIKQDFKQALCTAALLKLVGQNTAAYKVVEDFSKSTGVPELKGRALVQMATLTGLASLPDATNTAIKLYQEAIELFNAYEKVATGENAANAFELEANALLGLAGVQRRAGRYDDALETLDSLKKELDEEKDSTLKKKKIEIERYTQFGLLYGLGNLKYRDLPKALDYIDKGIALAKSAGYVDSEATLLNCKGLIIRGDKDRLDEALECLNRALQLNIYMGSDRGCFQQLRNMGLIYGSKNQWDKAFESYASAETFLNRLKNVKGEFLEAWFRQGESLIKLERFSEAIVPLQKALEERYESGDWHNAARTLELLVQAGESQEQTEEYVSALIKIYADVFATESKLKMLEKTTIKAINAVSILGTALRLTKDPSAEKTINEFLDHELLKKHRKD